MPLNKEFSNLQHKYITKTNQCMLVKDVVISVCLALELYFVLKKIQTSSSKLLKMACVTELCLAPVTIFLIKDIMATSIQSYLRFKDLPPDFEYRNPENPNEIVLIIRDIADHNGALGISIIEKEDLLRISQRFSILSRNVSQCEEISVIIDELKKDGKIIKCLLIYAHGADGSIDLIDKSLNVFEEDVIDKLDSNASIILLACEADKRENARLSIAQKIRNYSKGREVYAPSDLITHFDFTVVCDDTDKAPSVTFHSPKLKLFSGSFFARKILGITASPIISDTGTLPNLEACAK